MPDWNPRANDLFLKALDRPPADRPAFLAAECGADAGLRRAVETLLNAHEMAGSFLADPYVPVGTTATFDARTHTRGATAAPVGEAGQLIAGRYKLIERIGEGGMGSVWLAEQTEPVKRKVAVKLIKAGLDSKQVLARFEAERQALALMDHPNIAKVLDGGVWAVASDQWPVARTDKTPPSSPDTGHRILATVPFFVMELVKGVPITDFCDARKLTPQQRLELFVPVCQAIQHAHQKGVIHRDIKPANVLVALYDDRPVPKVIDFGVAKATGPTLTEHTLNTGFGGVVGTPQYMSPEQATFNNLDIDTRSDVYSLGVLLYELLAGSPPFKRQELEKRGLLEILRVVREEEPPRPSTKLSTADALPSLAANRGTEPKKLTGLLRNELDWIVMKALEKDRSRRYETANGFAADVQRYLSGEPVVAVPPSVAYRLRKFVRKNKGPVVAAGLILLSLLAGVIGTSIGLLRAEEKRVEADQAKQRESERADGERQAKQSALAEKAKAEKAEEETLASYRASTDEAVRQLIGSKPVLGPHERAYLEDTAKRWQAFADRTGDDERSRVIRGEGHYRLGYLWERLGRREVARREFERALAIREKLAVDFPAVPEHRSNLASSHLNLANMLRDLGQRSDAEKHYRQALAIREKLAADFPAVPEHRSNLAWSHLNLGQLHSRAGEWTETEKHYREALAVYQRLVAAYPVVPDYRDDLVSTHNNYGIMLATLGKGPEAEAQYRKGLEIQEKLVADFPAEPRYRLELASIHNNLGNLLVGLGKREAEEQFRRAIEAGEKLVAEFPAVPLYRQELAGSHTNWGILLRQQGNPKKAGEQYRLGLAVREKLAAEFPAVTDHQVELGGSYCNYGNLVRDGGKPADSLAWFDKAIRTLTAVYERDRQLVDARTFLRNSHWNRALAYDSLRKHAEAAEDWGRAIELSSGDLLSTARGSRVMSRFKAGQIAEAVADVAEVRKLPGWNAGQLYDFACVYAVASGKVADKKAEYATAAVGLLQQAVKAGYKDAAHMKRDKDLDPLRDRDDFQKLLADLEAKFPPKREVLPPPRRE